MDYTLLIINVTANVYRTCSYICSGETSPTVSFVLPMMKVIKTQTYDHKVNNPQSLEYRNKVYFYMSKKFVNTLASFSTLFYPVKNVGLFACIVLSLPYLCWVAKS